jgi:hypothetical protein
MKAIALELPSMICEEAEMANMEILPLSWEKICYLLK